MTTQEAAPQEFQGRLAQGKDWREIVAWVGDLPPMPQVASRALSLVENPDTTATELTDLLSTDAALAARVLKIANSAMFSRQREITTLNQAIMVIGFKALKGIIVAATLRQINKSFGNTEKLIWEHSMGTGVASTLITKALKKPFIEEIFLLGLLHNLGQIVLLVQPDTAKEYKNVLKSIRESSLDYISAEQQVLGFAHPLIGALVAKKWNFSPETCQVILHYRDQIESEKAENQTELKTGIIQLADAIAHMAKIGTPEGYPENREAVLKMMKYVGFPADSAEQSLDDLVQRSLEQFQNERHIYD